jgi:hypothetical protein
MSQAEYNTWLLLCTRELSWLKTLCRINIRLLAHGQGMGYPELIALLDEYSMAMDALEECADTREEWLKLGLVQSPPVIQSMIERRRSRVWRQQERVSPMLDRILASCPQKAPRLILDTSGRFSIV